MDTLTIIGIIVSFGAIFIGNILEGGHTDSLLQITAFIIVGGGTVGAVLVQTPKDIFIRSIKIASWIFIPPKIDFEESIQKIINYSNTARKDGILGLESLVEDESDEFLASGLNMLVDGNDPEKIKDSIEIRIESIEDFDTQAAKVYESMGGYSPTIGIIGAVMGLIHVMNNLSDPSKLGTGIAVAFVATIYGVGLANLIFLPMASKLKTCIARTARYQEMILEGVLNIADGENPKKIEPKLRAYIAKE